MEAVDKASRRTTWFGEPDRLSTISNVSSVASAASSCRPENSSTSSMTHSSSAKTTSSPASYRRQLQVRRVYSTRVDVFSVARVYFTHECPLLTGAGETENAGVNDNLV